MENGTLVNFNLGGTIYLLPNETGESIVGLSGTSVIYLQDNITLFSGSGQLGPDNT